MSAWWWVPIGLAAWLSVSLAVGPSRARFFRHAAQARDALDALAEERPAERQEPPQDGPRVALWAPKARGAEALSRALPRGTGLPVGLVPAEARPGLPSWRINAVACRISWPVLGSGPAGRSPGA